MHFINKVKQSRGEEMIGEIGHLHSKRLSMMSSSAAQFGVRSDDMRVNQLLRSQEVVRPMVEDEFVYAVCRNSTIFYNPYDLRIVKRAAVPKDVIFYTVTRDNVMMVS